jgi:hypothetical protein
MERTREVYRVAGRLYLTNIRPPNAEYVGRFRWFRYPDDWPVGDWIWEKAPWAHVTTKEKRWLYDHQPLSDNQQEDSDGTTK